MSYTLNNENLYKEGTVITAKEDPSLKLIIMKYFQRIYYCALAGEPDRKHLAYFERELIPPVSLDQAGITDSIKVIFKPFTDAMNILMDRTILKPQPLPEQFTRLTEKFDIVNPIVRH